MKLIFLSISTTSLDPQYGEIWKIAAIVRTEADKNRTVDREYCWQIRPRLFDADAHSLQLNRYYERLHPDLLRAQPEAALRIVHPDVPVESPNDPITNAVKLTDAKDVAAELAVLLDGAIVVGLAPALVERFIQRFLRERGQAGTNQRHLIDVTALVGGALRVPPPWRLDGFLYAFELDYNEAGRHTALGEVRIARDLYDAVLGVEVKAP